MNPQDRHVVLHVMRANQADLVHLHGVLAECRRRRQRRRRQRQWCVRPWIARRVELGLYDRLLQELRNEDPT